MTTTPRPLTEDQASILSMYLRGMRPSDIATALGKDKSTVHRILYGRTDGLRDQTGLLNRVAEQLLEQSSNLSPMENDRLITAEEYARRLGITPRAVRLYAQRHGITPTGTMVKDTGGRPENLYSLTALETTRSQR